MTIPCFVANQKTPVDFFIGEPNEENHPLKFQQTWLSNTKGGQIPENVMRSMLKLYELSKTKGLDFGDLCEVAMKLVETKKEMEDGDGSKKKEDGESGGGDAVKLEESKEVSQVSGGGESSGNANSKDDAEQEVQEIKETEEA